MTTPLTPKDCDLRDFQFMPMDISRLFGSRFHAVCNDAEWRAGVTLWPVFSLLWMLAMW